MNVQKNSESDRQDANLAYLYTVVCNGSQQTKSGYFPN